MARSKFFSPTRAGLFSQKRMRAYGASRRAKWKNGEDLLTAAEREFEEETGTARKKYRYRIS